MTIRLRQDHRTGAAEHRPPETGRTITAPAPPPGRRGRSGLLAARDPELTKAEWLALCGALQDASQRRAMTSGRPGAMGRLIRWISGRAPPPPRSDPRRDAILAFVARARADPQPDPGLAEQLHQHGFNRRQIEALLLLCL